MSQSSKEMTPKKNEQGESIEMDMNITENSIREETETDVSGVTPEDINSILQRYQHFEADDSINHGQDM